MSLEEKQPDPQLEQIVAYLDGELSPDECAHVERRLSSDETYRRQLQGAQRVWAALDELPRATVDDRFARTTVAMAVDAVQEEIVARTQALPALKRRSRLSTGLSAAAATALALLGTRLLVEDPNRALVDDLPTIVAIDSLSQLSPQQDVVFLRTLRDRVGEHLAATDVAAQEIDAKLASLKAVAEPAGRRAWVESLSPAETSNLRGKFNQYRELTPQRREQMQSLEEQLAEDPGLMKFAMELVNWLGALPASRQYELRQMTADEQIAAVAAWAPQLQDEMALALSPEELKRFVETLRARLDDLRTKYARELRSTADLRDGRRGPPWGEPFGGRRSAALLRLAESLEGDGEWQKAVLAALPERSRERFQELPPQRKIERLLYWMRQAGSLDQRVTQEELDEFFSEELGVDERMELLALPAGQMHDRLLQLYRQRPGAEEAASGFGPPMRGRGFGPGPEGWGPRGPRGGGPPPEGGFDRPFDGPPGPDFLDRRDGFGPPRPQGPPPSEPPR